MPDDALHDLFDALSDEPLEPGADFVATLRAQVHDVAIGHAEPRRSLRNPIESRHETEQLVTELRGDDVMITLESPLTGAPRPRGRRILAAAAAIVAVLVAGVWLAGVVDEDSEVSTEQAIPLQGAEGNQDAIDAFAVVSDAYAAYNAGDIDTFLPAVTVGDEDIWVARTEEYLAALFTSGSRTDVHGCQYLGQGDWMVGGDEDNRIANGHLFTCEQTESIPFYDAASIDLSVTTDWVVADGQIVADSSDAPAFRDWLLFGQHFRRWGEETYPDVFADMRYLSVPSYFPKAESMDTALEYVDEFVETTDWHPPFG